MSVGLLSLGLLGLAMRRRRS